MSADRPRLLARRSELGYVDSPSQALTREPEAVSADDQSLLTERAGRTAQERRHSALASELDRVRREADYFLAQARHRERQARRLERRLAS